VVCVLVVFFFFFFAYDRVQEFYDIKYSLSLLTMYRHQYFVYDTALRYKNCEG
jgi:hypothetical protein